MPLSPSSFCISHLNPLHLYLSTSFFLLQAMSVSETWYTIKDHGTNYCNLYNLMEGKITDFQYSVLNDLNSFDRMSKIGRGFGWCLTANWQKLSP